ncbi:MAG TPA: Holliday junction branch migration protein RuvA [Bacteroidales bacterium]
MYDYITGKLTELTPTYLIVENNGIGYVMHISLNTYSKLELNTQARIFAHLQIKEDAHTLYGFYEAKEREVFRILISVSGIGANTARMILSSLTAEEVANAISKENVRALQNIKGIGAKTAQRMIVELKDKMIKIAGSEQNLLPQYNTSADEALSALVMLGFQKGAAEKALAQISRENKQASVEEYIKLALKVL